MPARQLIALAGIVVVLVAGCTDRPDVEPTAGGSGEAAGLPADVRENGLVAGAEMVVPPMAFYEDDGTTPTGVNVELAAALSEELGTEITFEQYAFEGLQPALQSGKIDMIFDVIDDTVERQEQMDFVDYLASGNTLLVAEGNPEGIEGLDGLCGLTLAAVRGSVQIELVEQASTACTEAGADQIAIDQYPGAADARLQVQHGRADAFIGNTPILLYVADTAGEGELFDAVPLEDSGSYYGVAFSQDDAQIRDAVNEAFAAIIADGTYAEILEKYGLGEVALEQTQINGATS